MAQPYVGEIRMFAGNFAPAGWMFCAGQLLPISENEVLFTFIGTMYGGDGESTFALPDLRGRVPIHRGSNIIQAETGGVEQVTLTVQQIPVHSHPVLASTNAPGGVSPNNAVLGASDSLTMYRAQAPNTFLNPVSVSPVGGSQPHTNFQPYLCVNFIISLFGLIPSPT